jgi:glycosyltransferase involved in cell wall biosynthesis
VEGLSVIVTAHNNAAVLPRTLQSARDAINFGREQSVLRGVAVEVVAVDDGSADGTGMILDEFARATGYTTVIHRPRPSSPSCARNTGASAARGELLCFLDGDDLYLPEHLAVCYRALLDSPQAGFVKTGVVLADPVHPDWRPWIEGSVVLNL